MDEESQFLTSLSTVDGRKEQLRGYITWLENRDHNRAQYLKLEMEILDLDSSDGRYRQCKAELRQLKPKVDSNWRLTVTQAIINNCGAIDAPEGLFEFQCPLQWGVLQPTSDPRVRFCNTCHQHVHLCDSLTEARALADRGACIAIDLTAKLDRKGTPQRDDYDDVSSKRRGRFMGRLAAPPKSKQDRLRQFPSTRLKAGRKNS